MEINISKINFAGSGGVCPPCPEYKSQSKDYSITSNGDTVISPDSGFDGISGGTISVNVPSSGGIDINTSGVKLAYSTFTEVPSNIIGWENLTNGYNMFRNCNGLTNFNIDLPNLTSATNMFSGCTTLIKFSSDLPLLTSGIYMFYNTKLLSWNINLPSLTNGSNMFNGTSLRDWNIELSKLTDGSYMFGYCKSLKSWTVDLPNLTNGKQMFYYCNWLESFSGNLSNLTDGSTMFSNCSKLQTFKSNLSSLSSGGSYFGNCNKLANITLTGTLNCNNFNLSYCNLLTVDSLVNVISVLVDLTGESPKTLKLGSTNLEKLSEEQKAVATNKNWVLS